MVRVVKEVPRFATDTAEMVPAAAPAVVGVHAHVPPVQGSKRMVRTEVVDDKPNPVTVITGGGVIEGEGRSVAGENEEA